MTDSLVPFDKIHLVAEAREILVKVKNEKTTVVQVWDRIFSFHDETWEPFHPGKNLEDCLMRVYTKSGAKTLEEFKDYIELQVTFNV